jgi:hypothetical protein
MECCSFIVGGVLYDAMKVGQQRYNQLLVVKATEGTSMVIHTKTLKEANQILLDAGDNALRVTKQWQRAVHLATLSENRITQKNMPTTSKRLPEGPSFVHMQGGRKINDEALSLVSIEGERNLPTFRTPGGESIPAVTVLTAGIQQGRPGVWVTHRTKQPIQLPQGCIRLTVTPVYEVNCPELHQFIRADDLSDCGGVVRANAETPEGIDVPCAQPEALRVYRRVPC